MIKRSVSTTGKWKNVIITDGHFIDGETGEMLDIMGEIAAAYGETPFDLTTTAKEEEDLGEVTE